MAINWDLYNTRLNANGSNARERYLNSFQAHITKHLPNSLSFKTVTINGINKNIGITKTSIGYKKEIYSLPNETFDIGDYVVYENKTYLITEIDNDKEAYMSGKMEECNFVIKFQHPTTLAILSYPCITSNKSFSQDENNMISLGANQKSILLPYDENTSLLTVDKRMYVDKRNKTPYAIIGDIDTTTYNYGDKGLMYFVVEQELTNSTNDRPDLGVCNYIEPTVTPTPTGDIIVGISCTSSTSFTNKIKLGVTYTFASTVKYADGTIVTDAMPRYTLDNTYDGMVVLTDKLDGTCTVKVNSGAISIVTKQVVLTCMDNQHGFASSIAMTIASIY